MSQRNEKKKDVERKHELYLKHLGNYGNNQLIKQNTNYYKEQQNILE
jgi:hypothetical protein